MRHRLHWLSIAALLISLDGCLCGGILETSRSGRDAGGDGGTGGPQPCSDGERCGDGGICAAGDCCDVSRLCGTLCCDAMQVCSFSRCLTAGAECRENSECGAEEYCDFSKPNSPDAGNGTTCFGETAPRGRCLSKPPLCAEGQTFLESGDCIETCRFSPQSLPFEVQVNFEWAEGDVMMTPIVTQLDDDNCDGKVTASDMPDVLFSEFYASNYLDYGTTHALTVRQGALVEKWRRTNVFVANSSLASGNIDGITGSEVVGCGRNRLVALKGDGTTLWDVPSTQCAFVSLADLDGNGKVEVVTDFQVFDGKTGTQKFTFSKPALGHVVADLNDDGFLDVIGSGLAFTHEGVLLADTGREGTFAGVADFDLDGKPEVVTVQTATHSVFIWRYNSASTGFAEIVRQSVDINGPISMSRCPGLTGGGGPPTMGDFNGDGTPDLALAGGVGYAVMDGKKLMNPSLAGNKTFLWTRETKDCSSATTGSSLFDFDGDGKTEVVYADEDNLHIYDSATGQDRVSVCNRNGTINELPVVADVDNDGQADLLVTSNAYHGWRCSGAVTKGLRIFGSVQDNWVSTRRIWNQHAYSHTNIEEDGTVPQGQKPNWLQPGLNNFRQQKQPGFEFAASDALAHIEQACLNRQTIRVVLRNLGEAPLPPGIRVEVLKGEELPGAPLGTVVSTRTLGSAESEVFDFKVADEEVMTGIAPVFTRVLNSPRDCRPGNDVSKPISVSCVTIN